MSENKSNIPEKTFECSFDPCDECDTVTIPRSEYNDLIAAKTINDMILSVADINGYGCADTVKGLRNLDKYRKALTDAENRIIVMTTENEEHVGKLLAEISSLTASLNALLDKSDDNAPEGKPDA